MSSYVHTSSTPTISKNERRRRERREKKRQLKQEKKQRIKQAKIQQAQQEGRDWNAEIQAQQQFVKERTQSGDRQKRLELLWKEKIQRASSTFRICIDCSYETSSSSSPPPPAAIFNDNDVATPPPSAAKASATVFMNEREVASLAQQIRYCYSYNKKNTPYPHLVTVTGLTDPTLEPPDHHHHTDHNTSSSGSSGGRLLELLKKEVGFEQWEHRGFTCTTKPFHEYYASDDNSGGDSKDDNSTRNDTNDTSEPQDRDSKEDENDAASSRSRCETIITEATTKSDSILSKMVYLTSDATTTLRELDDTKIYIIGGIVDRNKSKRAAIDRAETLGISTAKLPLEEFYESHPEYKMKGSTKVLAVNHVFDILLRVHRYGGNDWDRALEEVLPSRKQEKNKTTVSSKVADKDKKGNTKLKI
mmetsp:Transcript_61506/g.150541  ORF Transcript_61506/g.150541 Transcript_61506/m.150541 type:complete len:418 (+) Transcript_61506:101-1354(+)